VLNQIPSKGTRAWWVVSLALAGVSCTAESPGHAPSSDLPDPRGKTTLDPVAQFSILPVPEKTSWRYIKCAGSGEPGAVIHVRNTDTRRTNSARVSASGTFCIDLALEEGQENHFEVQAFGKTPSDKRNVTVRHEPRPGATSEALLDRRIEEDANRTLSGNQLHGLTAETNMSVRDPETRRAVDDPAALSPLTDEFVDASSPTAILEPDPRAATNWLRFKLVAPAQIELIRLIAPCAKDYDVYLSYVPEGVDPGPPGPTAFWNDAPVTTVSDGDGDDVIRLSVEPLSRWVGFAFRGPGCPVAGVPGKSAFQIREISALVHATPLAPAPTAPEAPAERVFAPPDAPICANHGV